ncbi:MAG: phosphoribosylformylglycinamidine cyclo-ligase [Archaeoglobaceae archaeon]|nr:phosphoribosylformylglycinamidine cyclo-ligase [Archaeoglobaceae archaeon]
MNKGEKFDYAKAGVDIRKEEKAIKALIGKIKHIRKGFGEPILMGHYASVIDVGVGLAITTDGVGSKIMIAEALNKFDTIGIDCVAMNVNDLIAIGAEPIAMVDYIAIQKPDERVMEEIAVGLEKGCEIANITLVGGETATLPEMINGIDLVGTAIGVVEKDKIITGEKIEIGDVIVAIESSGIHSNGLTLARKVVEKSGLSYEDEFDGKTIGEELLTPTRIYIEVLDIVKNYDVHGLAHITGGGMLNLKRLKNVRFVIDKPLKPQKIFNFIQELGNVDEDEMYRTFNMGMGFMIILPKDEAKKIDIGKIVGYVDEGSGVYVKDLRIDK